ncbi:MAG: hypothetical protein A2514_10190 [Gammaproteobacteria bacterium RIFOXYD12_FULL_61_37]|nr:MAG: hypothetical protein A2514_10190 [Gammaproteobacteria bacterium RIFOXYD12_FULL_61_37]
MKRAAIYRATRKYLLDTHRDQVLEMAESGKQDGKDKRTAMQLWTWEYAQLDDDASQRVVKFCFFMLEAKDPLIQEATFAVMGRHAIARLLQMERTDDLAKAMAQAGPRNWAALCLAILNRNVRDTTTTLAFCLNNGVAVCAWDEQERHFVVKTVIGYSAMSPSKAEGVLTLFAASPYIPWPPRSPAPIPGTSPVAPRRS